MSLYPCNTVILVESQKFLVKFSLLSLYIATQCNSFRLSLWILLPNCHLKIQCDFVFLLDVVLKLLTIIYVLQAANQGKGADSNVTKYSVKVLPVSSGSYFSFTLSICYKFPLPSSYAFSAI